MKKFLYIFVLLFSGNILTIVEPQQLISEITDMLVQVRNITSEVKTTNSFDLKNQQTECHAVFIEHVRNKFQSRVPLQELHNVYSEYARCLNEKITEHKKAG